MQDSTIIDGILYNAPPVINQSELPAEISVFNDTDLLLILGLLIFGVIFQALLTYSIFRGKIDQEKYLILTVINLIIVAALFMLIAGFSSERTTPLLALLGTIVGYVLGNKK